MGVMPVTVGVPLPGLRRAPLRGLLVVAVLLLAMSGHAQQAPSSTEPTGPDFQPLPTPSLNFYGSPGLIDMPSAEMFPEGQFVTSVAGFGDQARFTVNFQPLPWLSGAFRYNRIGKLNLFGFETFYDRNFDVRFRLLKETGYRPGITLGLQDFAGTGVFSGEYIVATKSFETPPWGGQGEAGQLKVTGGLGWGRLGSHGTITTIGERPTFTAGRAGDQVQTTQLLQRIERGMLGTDRPEHANPAQRKNCHQPASPATRDLAIFALTTAAVD